MSSTLPGVSQSAGDHVWRQMRVDVWPGAHAVRWSVFLRRNRGTDLIWARNLASGSTPPPVDGALETGAGVLRTVAAALLEVAEEMDRTGT
jgi:hypothetical protein